MGLVHEYIVTVEYVTPTGKASTYTDTVYHYTPFDAANMVKKWLYSHKRRRVSHILRTSVTR